MLRRTKRKNRINIRSIEIEMKRYFGEVQKRQNENRSNVFRPSGRFFKPY